MIGIPLSRTRGRPLHRTHPFRGVAYLPVFGYLHEPDDCSRSRHGQTLVAVAGSFLYDLSATQRRQRTKACLRSTGRRLSPSSPGARDGASSAPFQRGGATGRPKARVSSWQLTSESPECRVGQRRGPRLSVRPMREDMANNLFVSYDLHAPAKNYEAVITAIKKLGAWGKVHYSLWYVKSAHNATEACNLVWSSMDDCGGYH